MLKKIDLLELSGDKNEISTKIGEMRLVDLTTSKNTIILMHTKVASKAFYVSTEDLYNMLGQNINTTPNAPQVLKKRYLKNRPIRQIKCYLLVRWSRIATWLRHS